MNLLVKFAFDTAILSGILASTAISMLIAWHAFFARRNVSLHKSEAVALLMIFIASVAAYVVFA